MRRGWDRVWMTTVAIWFLGMWLLPAMNDGLGRFLAAGWTTAGAIYLLEPQVRTRPEVSVAILCSFLLLGLLWWWSSAPGSWIGNLGPWVGPGFLGAGAGLLAGFIGAAR